MEQRNKSTDKNIVVPVVGHRLNHVWKNWSLHTWPIKLIKAETLAVQVFNHSFKFYLFNSLPQLDLVLFTIWRQLTMATTSNPSGSYLPFWADESFSGLCFIPLRDEKQGAFVPEHWRIKRTVSFVIRLISQGYSVRKHQTKFREAFGYRGSTAISGFWFTTMCLPVLLFFRLNLADVFFFNKCWVTFFEKDNLTSPFFPQL